MIDAADAGPGANVVLDRVSGQKGPVGFMRAAMARGRLGHAYLMVGPDGVGKRMLSRAVAASLRCANGGCGECHSCRSALTGSAPGLVEIEPQGRAITVDRIRELRTEISRHPGGWMVIVIDPASSLGAAAANALLKSLEEPPASTVFFLLAESEAAVLPTLRSRCQLIRFGLLSDGDIESLLREQGASSTEAALWARAARGHMDRATAAAADPEFGARRADLESALSDTWHGVPSGRERLFLSLSEQLKSRQGAVKEVGDARTDVEMSFLGSGRGSAGVRSALEDRTKRETDKVATAATREVCDSMAGWILEVAAAQEPRHGDIVGALTAISEALAILEYNVDQTRVLDSLVLRIASCGASTTRR